MRLKTFLASPEEQGEITKWFGRPHAHPLNFLKMKPTYLSEVSKDGGVYFIAGERDKELLKVYVGKTTDFRRRMEDYHRPFQVHSPNDRKLAIFMDWLLGIDEKWTLRLYTHPVGDKGLVDKGRMASEEKRWIKYLDPLVNATHKTGGLTTSSSESELEGAYKKYFKEYFLQKAKLEPKLRKPWH